MKKLSFPHPIILLTALIFIAAILSYVIPAGEYERQRDEATGRDVVVSGTYERVESSPVGFFDTFVAIPRGMIEAADVVFLVFLIGGSFMVVDQTQALRKGVAMLTNRFKGSEFMVLIVLSIAFVAAGALNNTQEEIIALVPVLLILMRRLGYRPLVAVAVSFGSAVVGASFSPINPFQVQIAQKLAQLPLLSGGGFRLIFLLIATAVWTYWIIRFARKTQSEPEILDDSGTDTLSANRTIVILSLVVLTFAIMVYGILSLHWDFNQMSALFFIMGIIAGLVGKLGLSGTAKAYSKGFSEMAFAALLIGFARAIFVVLDDGRIMDSIVAGLFTPIQDLPAEISGIGMVVAHILLHIPVPSVSGQAVLTMPLLIPLSDLIGMSRQVTILAYQAGAGMTDLITPTNGALIAVLAAAGVKYQEWWAFALKKFLLLILLSIIAIIVAIAIGL